MLNNFPKNSITLNECWAKTDPESCLPILTVEDHCLTVGAVAAELYSILSPCIKKQLPKGALTLVASHDIGKLTPGFQLKAPKWIHYDLVSSAILRDNLCNNHSIISQKHLHGHTYYQQNSKAAYWLVSTGGHHGRYPVGFDYRIDPKRCFEGGNCEFIALRNELLNKLIETFGPLPTELAKQEHERVHLLTGFTIFSDWIGSNTDWFPSENSIELSALRATAKKCLNQLHWKAAPKPNLSFGQQFNPSNPSAFKARSIQSALLKAADTPGLYIVEAPMGLGKTEAALTAAYKRWTEGDEHGLYFALPTQLTSNKIHERIEAFLKNTIGSESVQTLIHGTAWLKDGQSKRLIHANPEEENNDTNEALCWYSSTRKQLLAPFGTGTIDQALLAVLPAKFAALRYFALAGKVVVIDEVHSFDPYMSALIDRLIRYLVKAGSTVIILSATLTAQRRSELVQAAGATEAGAPADYPLITKVAAGTDCAIHFPVPCEIPSKQVHLRHEHLNSENEDAFWDSIVQKVEDGANVVVIRNTVALAQDTYRQLKARLSSCIAREHIGLLHSRFPQNEREENEGHWTGILGKDDNCRPTGSLLVSTQIVEQSVDIDADCLVTDLAPTELILQRIGRLHRHKRPRPQGYDEANCHILHPKTHWKGSVKKVKDALKPHNFIYPPLSLWQATQTLVPRNSIKLPEDIRPLLEAAANLQPLENAPPSLHEFASEYTSKRDAMHGTAKIRDVFNATAIDDQEGTETRYGIQPTAQLIMLPSAPTEQGNRIQLQLPDGTKYNTRSGEFNYGLAKALHKIATRIPAYLVKPQLIAAPDWLKQHIDSAVIVIQAVDSTELQYYATDDSPYTLHYRRDLGITYQKKEPSISTMETEDFWF